MSEPLNCWEYTKCGREPGGAREPELGVCPASLTHVCDGINRGKRAGRVCWAVAGTLCHGQIQGTQALKLGNCLRCDFFNYVAATESDFVFSPHEIVKA